MSMQEIPKTLGDALGLFKQESCCQDNPRLVSNVRTSLRLHVLPYLQFHQFTKQELESNLNGCLASIDIISFQASCPNEILERRLQVASDMGEVKPGTVRNYRSALKRFTEWLQQQNQISLPSNPGTDESGGVEVQNDSPVPNKTRAPHMPTGRNLDTARRGKRCTSVNPYALKPEQYPPRLKRQIEAQLYELTEEDFDSAILKQLKKKPSGLPPSMGLHYFWTAPAVAKRRDRRIRQVTFDQTMKHIHGFLGWYQNVRRSRNRQELSLELLADDSLLREFIAWGISERGNGYGWAHQVACSSLHVLKWLHHQRSKQSSYKDIDAIQERRGYINECHKEYEMEGYRYNSENNLKEKLLSFEECVALVEKLRQYCCETRQCDRSKRSMSSVIRSWQRYLVIAILTYCPIRQFEIRRLQLNVNLFREPDGYWVTWTPDEHKTGSKTGNGRSFPLLLPPEITSDLDTWVQKWQPYVKQVLEDVDEWLKFWHKTNASPQEIEKWKTIWERVEFQEDLVFFSLGGNASRNNFGRMWAAGNFGSFVSKTVYRFTGKRPSPHTFRNIGITHQRQNGDPDQRIALAEVMGHDPVTADRIYDMTTSKDKSKKAKDWWKSKHTQ